MASPTGYEVDLLSHVYAFGDEASNQHDMIFEADFSDTFEICVRDDFQILADHCLDIIESSPTGYALLEYARAQGYRFGFAQISNNGYMLSGDEKFLYLDIFNLGAETLNASQHYQDYIVLNMIRALRDIYFETKMADITRLYRIEDILKVERARMADIEAITAKVAWELRAENEIDHLWRALIGQEEGDIAIAFWQILDEHSKALYDGRAVARAFKQWYTCQRRCDAADRETLDYLDGILKENPGTNPFGTHKLSENIFESLYLTINKKRYLAGWGSVILNDPSYVAMQDVYNQTHLLQLSQDIQLTVKDNIAFSDPHLASRLFPKEGRLL